MEAYTLWWNGGTFEIFWITTQSVPPLLIIVLYCGKGGWIWKGENDAPLSPGMNPLEGFTLRSCGKVGLRAHSWLPIVKRGRGSCWEPRDRLGRGTSLAYVNLHPKTNHKRLV
jgi:hypothetical protein